MKMVDPQMDERMPQFYAQPTTNHKNRSTKSIKKAEMTAMAPIFLRKTYTMIDSCDPTIASWSANGLMFVVKDIEKFACEVIPEFFTHNNFSSFVRQLNFYGFRKIKSDPLRIKDAETDEESKFWKFRHEKFQRGRPDLLAEIRKSYHNESANKQEVDSLKAELQDLKDRYHTMKNDLDKMTALIGNLINAQQVHEHGLESNKRRKTTEPSTVSSAPDVPVSDAALARMSISSHYSGMDEYGSVDPHSSGLKSTRPMEGDDLISACFTTQEEEMLSSLFSFDPAEACNAWESYPSGSAMSCGYKPISKVDDNLVKRFKDSLKRLPKGLQSVFVDRIVATIIEPEYFKKQVEAMESLALASFGEAKRRLTMVVESPDVPKCVPLASAVLNTYLARYSGQLQMKGNER